jgi:hypothetical protein
LRSFGKNQDEDNNFGNFGKIQKEKDHGFEGMARKKKTTLGTLEKTMKKKTITLKFWPRRIKTIAMEFWKKTKNKNNTTLGALEKTMKEKTTTLGALEKSRKKKTWL